MNEEHLEEPELDQAELLAIGYSVVRQITGEDWEGRDKKLWTLLADAGDELRARLNEHQLYDSKVETHDGADREHRLDSPSQG